MLPSIKKPQKQIRKDKLIEKLFQSFEEKVPQTKEDFNYEILQNLEPVHVEGIYFEKKYQSQPSYSRQIGINNPLYSSKNHLRNSSMQELYNTKELDADLHNVFTPRGNNLNFLNNYKKAFNKIDSPRSSRSPGSPRSPSSPRELENSGSLSQRGFVKSKSQQTIQVDQIEETNYFEEVFQKKQQEIEENENLANENLPPHILKEYTKRWGEVDFSMKKTDRLLQQEVSQTMNTINTNLKQIVVEQDKKRIIRNLTSLDSIFQVAKNEILELKVIDLTNEKEKKQIRPKQLMQDSISNLPTIPKVFTIQTEPNQQDSQKKSSYKFKKITNFNPKFSLMYSRFIKKLHYPHLKSETHIEKKKFLTKFRQQQLDYKPKTNLIPYQGLQEMLQDNTFQQQNQENSYTTQNLSKDTSQYLPILQVNRSTKNKITNNSEEQTLNGSNLFDKSKLSSTIDTYYGKQMNRTLSLHKTYDSSAKKITQTQPNKLLNKSQSSKSIYHKKQNNLPKFLIPFKDLVLSTWKGKIGPTQEENVLFSNCLGMLSLHKEMKEGIHEIKEYQFDLKSQYTAVPSKSTRLQKNAEKKFKKVIKQNVDTKQMLINMNIQQLDQIVELDDPIDYLISDNY
ncbi:hypothetical protein ABPG72_022376 [Tetrahymena utriculariae]